MGGLNLLLLTVDQKLLTALHQVPVRSGAYISSTFSSIRSTVAEHFGTINADNLKRAHELLESQLSRGKIVLEGF